MNQRPQTDDAIGRSAMTKAMWRILPLILLAYVVAYIDRVNVSFASLQMNDDLKFSATIHGLKRWSSFTFGHASCPSAANARRQLSSHMPFRCDFPRTEGEATLQEIENTRVNDPRLAEAHVMTAAWDEFAFGMRNQPTCPLQCLRRAVDHFAVTEEQQHRHMQAPQLIIG